MFKQIGRIALAVLVTLALALGMTAFAGSANAASNAASASACSSQQASVAQAQHKVAKDKKKQKLAKRHHHKKAAKKARKHLKRDKRNLAAAQRAYNSCMSQPSGTTPAPAPTPTPTPAPTNPVTEQCLSIAGQLTALDPTGTFAGGAAAFCDLLGQLTASVGGDPTALCGQLAAQDPTGQLGQICTALGGAALPGLPGLPGVPSLPGDGGLIGGTLEQICSTLAAQDPTGQLKQLCTGLGGLPI